MASPKPYVITSSHWEREQIISILVANDQRPDSTYLHDIRAWVIASEEAELNSIAREPDVIAWANERGIFDQSSPAKQHSKTLEEVQELTDALAADDRPEIKDAIGDIAVTLILQAHMQGWTLGECLESAYQTIKNRKGVMKGGLFVKDGDEK